MITTRKAYLYINKDNKKIAASKITLFSRASGFYLEAEVSTKEKLKINDEVKVFYVGEEGDETLVSTLTIYSIPRLDSKIILYASDLYRDKLKAIVPSSAWRKATAEEIASSVLSSCDVDNVDLSALSSVTLPHFSCFKQNGWTVLKSLLHSVNSMTGNNLEIIPSQEGTLTIQELSSFSDSLEAVTVFDTDIVEKGESKLSCHLLGVVYGQKVSFRGKEFLVKESVMTSSSEERSTLLCLAS